LLYGIALADGKVPAPDRPVSAALSSLRGMAAENARRIRVRDLLDMDSGLAWREGTPGINDEMRMFWVRDLSAHVLGRPLAAESGTRFNYNSGGTALLAQIIAKGERMPLDQFAEQRLFRPLGIRTAEWVADIHGRPMPFNGLRLRPRDLLKIGRLVLNHGQWHGAQLVPAQWVAASWTPGLATGVVDFRYHHQWWSGTVAWHGRSLAWHAAFGNGGQRLFVVPDLDLAMVTNAGAYDEEATAIAVNRLLQEVVATIRS
jgi:CubicO group peptidase (beta-lactamase class C family)